MQHKWHPMTSEASPEALQLLPRCLGMHTFWSHLLKMLPLGAQPPSCGEPKMQWEAARRCSHDSLSWAKSSSHPCVGSRHWMKKPADDSRPEAFRSFSAIWFFPAVAPGIAKQREPPPCCALPKFLTNRNLKYNKMALVSCHQFEVICYAATVAGIPGHNSLMGYKMNVLGH